MPFATVRRRGSVARLAVAVLLAWCTMPFAAAAQIPTSTHDVLVRPYSPEQEEIAHTDAVLRDLIACVIRYQPARTRNLLATIPGSHAERTIVRSLRSRMETCYDYFQTGARALVFATPIVRGMIAEQYYRRDFPNGLAAASPPAAEAAAVWTAPRPSPSDDAGPELVHAMARCVVVQHPAEVAALIAAEPFTMEERRALAAVTPHLSPCLYQGVNLDASRQSLRGVLAEAVLQYAEAQREGFSSPPGRSASRD